jgi:hypothetical protein
MRRIWSFSTRRFDQRKVGFQFFSTGLAEGVSPQGTAQVLAAQSVLIRGVY